MRLSEFLSVRQVPFEKLVHAPAYTAQNRAKYLGVSGKKVAKAVLLRSQLGYVLAVLPATKRVDTAVLSATFGAEMRIASREEVAEVYPDCEWGVVGPCGTLYGLPTVLDDSVASDDMLIFESDTHTEAIRIRCAEYERLECPRRLAFAI